MRSLILGPRIVTMMRGALGSMEMLDANEPRRGGEHLRLLVPQPSEFCKWRHGMNGRTGTPVDRHPAEFRLYPLGPGRGPIVCPGNAACKGCPTIIDCDKAMHGSAECHARHVVWRDAGTLHSISDCADHRTIDLLRILFRGRRRRCQQWILDDVVRDQSPIGAEYDGLGARSADVDANHVIGHFALLDAKRMRLGS